MNTSINFFSPLPPAKNGIADYSAAIVEGLSARTRCYCYSLDRWSNSLGVEVRDPLSAFMYTDEESVNLYQIGNNPGHIFVLESLRRYGGVVTLHDLSLLYLYEITSANAEELICYIFKNSPDLGDIYKSQYSSLKEKYASDYALLDMTGEILQLADFVIVHSDYARLKLSSLHAEFSDKIRVIPHFAYTTSFPEQHVARSVLNITESTFVIITCGFASNAKRFDWVINSLIILAEHGVDFHWFHVGQENPEEFGLSAAVDQSITLKGKVTITGYVNETYLNNYISAADIVINLRYPSVGESSGTLSRCLIAGKCCIVTDTAAYSEIPRDAVIHIKPFNVERELARALINLHQNPSEMQTRGSAARRYAEAELDIGKIVDQYASVIAESRASRRRFSSEISRGGIKSSEITYYIDRDLPEIVFPPPHSSEENWTITLIFSSIKFMAQKTLDLPSYIKSLPGSFMIKEIKVLQEDHPKLPPDLSGCFVLKIIGIRY